MFRRHSLLIVGAVLLLSTGAATADTLTDRIRIDNAPGDTGGGEFIITVLNGLPLVLDDSTVPDDPLGINYGPDPLGKQFRTFCVQLNENFAPGSEYYVEVTTATVADGKALQASAQVLYSAFRDGTLSGGILDPDDNVTPVHYQDGSWGSLAHRGSADDLQEAIWRVQQEDGYTTDTGLSDRTLDWIDWAGAQPLPGTSVRVLNLYRYANKTGNRQDQLTLILSGDVTPIPTPTSVLAGVTLLLGLGFIRMRRRRSHPG